MKRWEQLEEHLFDKELDGADFTSRELADEMAVSRSEASAFIQSYLWEQTRPAARTLFVLTRSGRTNAAIWHVGARAADARYLGRQTSDDFRRRLNGVVGPTLMHIGQRNPRALPAANAIMKGIEAGVELMSSMLGGDSELSELSKSA